jgi:hypothetical protein
MTSEDVTIVQTVRGHDGGGSRRTGLTEAQKTGQACVHCGGTDAPDAMEHLGYVNGNRVKIHAQCVGRWRHGDE